MKSVRYYDFTLTAGSTQVILAEGDNFRIQSQTGALDVTVEGVGTLPGLLTGQGLTGIPYKRLILRDASGAGNTGTILVAPAEFVDNRTYGVNTLDGATLNTLRTPLQSTGNYKAVGALAIATAEQVFSAASNVNGAIVLTATVSDIGPGGSATSSNQQLGFVAKATAPASIVDGEPIFMQGVVGANSTYYYCAGQLSDPQYVPAGQGLFFISANAAVSANGSRTCRYILR